MAIHPEDSLVKFGYKQDMIFILFFKKNFMHPSHFWLKRKRISQFEKRISQLGKFSPPPKKKTLLSERPTVPRPFPCTETRPLPVLWPFHVPLPPPAPPPLPSPPLNHTRARPGPVRNPIIDWGVGTCSTIHIPKIPYPQIFHIPKKWG